MGPLLWTYEDVVRFVHHPEASLREWAVERLLKLFPDRAADVLVEMLDDADFHVVRQAAEFLGGTGDRERYGPRLLEQLERASDQCADLIGLALARLDCREALPHLLDRLERLARQPGQLGLGAGYFLCEALGLFGGRSVRQALWDVVRFFPRDLLGRPSAVLALLEAALPQDVERLVQLYRSREAGPDRGRYLDGLATAAGVGLLAGDMLGAVEDGLETALDQARWCFGVDPPLSPACLGDLERAFRRKFQGALEVMLDEARRIVDRRGDDLDGWRAAWDTGIRPVGYRRRTLLTVLVLESLVRYGHPYPKLRHHESALGLAMLCQLSVDRDDLAFLEAAADRPDALLDILTADRENVLPDVVEQVAALGPEIAPRLIARLDPEDSGWGMIRVVQAIEQLARRYPGSCDAAVPLLIETINEEQGDFLLEACSAALAAIGPMAVPAISARLRDDDLSRQIYLTGVLEEIPTERSARAILDWIADDLPAGEMQFWALANIGSAAAIEPLYEIWQEDPEDAELARSLLVLCELNGVQKPELPQWREMVREGGEPLITVPAEPPEEADETLLLGWEERAAGAAGEPQRRLTRKAKAIGAKERRKRAAQRKSQRRKKKRRR